MAGTSRKKYPLFPGLDLQYTNMSNQTETSGETVPLKIALFTLTAYWGSDSKEKYIQREQTPGPTRQHIITFLASGVNVKGHTGETSLIGQPTKRSCFWLANSFMQQVGLSKQLVKLPLHFAINLLLDARVIISKKEQLLWATCRCYFFFNSDIIMKDKCEL